MQVGRPLSFLHARLLHALAPLKWRQYHHDDRVTSRLQEAVTFLAVRVFVLACSDASWWEFGLEDETEPPRLGWLFLCLMECRPSLRNLRGKWYASGFRENNRSCAQKPLHRSLRCTTALNDYKTRRCCGSLTTWVQ